MPTRTTLPAPPGVGNAPPGAPPAPGAPRGAAAPPGPPRVAGALGEAAPPAARLREGRLPDVDGADPETLGQPETVGVHIGDGDGVGSVCAGLLSGDEADRPGTRDQGRCGRG